MLALNAIAAGALMPLGSLVGSLQQVQMARAQLQRIRDLLETPLEQTPAPRAVRLALTGEVRVDHVCFRYHHGGPLVLEDICCTARRGDVIAIVGRSGSGKSTLARLLIGLHEPSTGRVLFDGLSLRSLDYARVRRQCGVVLQDSAVFNLSIRENIAFGRPDVTFDEVVRAARIAELHDDIMRMPMGYDTCVLEAGSGLSGGQRQRLLIARAIAHGPALLVLDEATSHLDAQMEQRIMTALSALTCTRVLIAHRMVTTQDADLVLVLEGGRVVEQGPPMALMRRGGVYAALVAEQRVRSPAAVEVDRA
jgi:ABC-type bacteriocin/lantibiotic exporter with double-glycine peptidase domain